MVSSLSLAWLASSLTLCLGAQSYCERGYRPLPAVDGQLDLSRLNKKIELVQESNTHPGKTSNQWQINICDTLPAQTNENDCETGTYICHRVVYRKGTEDYVATVQSIAGEFKDSGLKSEFRAIENYDDLSRAGTQFSLTLNGGQNEAGQAQSASIALECDPSQDRNAEPSEPSFISYQNNVLSLHWRTVFACGFQPNQAPPKNGNESSPSSSVVTQLVKMTFYFGLIYFIGGAVYNRIVYNARGQDLIIHRDFWLDLPFVIKDTMSRIMDTILSRRRGGSGGYVAV
ncbi:hypothetical protein DM01DRAFT_1407852 [Hesseltinella vesiculosa]|uniref:Autophagy-related protein 27 n=1 Tax=Hesseltinella vesiculosa TaxID=101127 RepID=A0A1X2GG25_9FUNG|nr:hypothetical protein DM01DRAFT_1407852 [Hesseltinella vesiculosa]